MPGSSLERIRRQTAVFDTLENITLRSPTLTRHAQDLSRHHQPSGKHVIDVTLATIDAAIRLGQDPWLAGFRALGHDSGKDGVPEWALNGARILAISKFLIRRPHVELTREHLQRVPTEEFAPYSRHTVMAGCVGHHDLWYNIKWYDRYPRRGIPWPRFGRERRQPLTNEELAGLAVLTLADRASRIRNGYSGNGHTNETGLRTRLQQIISRSRIPISHSVLSTYADAVANATQGITPDMMQEAMRIVGVKNCG